MTQTEMTALQDECECMPETDSDGVYRVMVHSLLCPDHPENDKPPVYEMTEQEAYDDMIAEREDRRRAEDW